MNNITINNINKIDKSIKTLIIPFIYKKKNTGLGKYIEQFINLDNSDKINKNYINEIEKQLSNKETNFTIFMNIGDKQFRLFFLNIILEDEEYNLLLKSYDIVEKDKNIGEIIDIIRIKGSNLYNEVVYNSVSEFNIGMISQFNKNVNRILNNGLLEGMLLTSYKYEKYKTEKSEDVKIKKIINVYPNLNNNEIKEMDFFVKRMLKQIETIFLARNMINEPANVLSSTKFVSTIVNYAKLHNAPVHIEVIGRDTLKKMGMNLLVSVGEGSKPEYQSKLMLIHYNPNKGINKVKNPKWVLIGKGVTFDTGGISLKFGEDTHTMKSDMAGGAVVASFVIGHSLTNGEDSILCMIPLAENNINNNPTRPGDVITAYNGKTVEIVDTDAEGRLLLADCLSYASEKYPKSKIIDLATLTGDQEYFSCKQFSNIFTRDKALEEYIVDAGNYIQEKLVAIPYMKQFKSYLESDTADLKNISLSSDCSSGMITSYMFLEQFVDENVSYCHLDIAAKSFNDVSEYSSTSGASGVGVRLLYEIIN